MSTSHQPPIELPLAFHTASSPPYFARNSVSHPLASDSDSPLLRSIRKSLRATRGNQAPIQSIYYSPSADGATGDEVLSWDSSTVTLTQGGVLLKKWSFADPVQWACIGWLFQSSLVHTSTPSTPAYYREDPSEKVPLDIDPNERPTFGAFARARMENKREEDREERTKGVFVFVRGQAKIYMDNGSEHTLNLPFIVQRAWPVEPHGLFIQRVVEGWELDEIRQSGQAGITTIFTLTSPFSEPATIGLTDGIKGDYGAFPLELKPDYCSEPVSIPPEERIIWVSQHAWKLTDKLLVTLNAELNRVTVWRYVYAPPPPSSSKSTARPTTHAHHAKRSSMSGNTSAHLRQSNATTDDLHLSPGRPDTKRSSIVPGLAPTLTTTTTLEDLMGGAVGGALPQSQWNRPFPLKTDPSGKLDLNPLGTAEPVNLDDVPDPAEEKRMQSQFWVEKLHEETLPEAASVDPFPRMIEVLTTTLPLIGLQTTKAYLSLHSTRDGTERAPGPSWAFVRARQR